LDGVRQAAADLGIKFNSTAVLASVKKAAPLVHFIIEIGGGKAGNVSHIPLEKIVGKEGAEYIEAYHEHAGISAVDDFDILLAQPQPGIYQVDKKVAFLRRLPARQYREGMSTQNTYILLDGVTRVQMGRTFDALVLHLFKDQKDLTLEEGMDTIKSESSLRLTERYWLKCHGRDLTLFRNRTDVGTWSCSHFYWSAMSQMLREELKNELNFKCP
jgi:hypothetical protein